jgi:hypothetical protein
MDWTVDTGWTFIKDLQIHIHIHTSHDNTVYRLLVIKCHYSTLSNCFTTLQFMFHSTKIIFGRYLQHR